jgi:hypothetical protein
MGVNESNVADITRSKKSALRLPTGVTPYESPMDVKGSFDVDGDAARQDMKGPLEMSRADSY